MAKLVSLAEMVAIERAANAAGLSYAQMMENAGRNLAATLFAYSQDEESSALALVGKGNNGGDALVALAALAEQGWQASAYLVERARDEYSERLEDSGGLVLEHGNIGVLREAIAGHEMLLDGLLGTGIKLPLRAPIPEMLAAAKETLDDLDEAPLVIAVDCPSGMDCERGEAAPETLAADLTVCMAAVKNGMLNPSAFDLLGELVIVEIGLPDDLPEWMAIRRYAIDEVMVLEALPERAPDSHKGSFGTAMIVAGSGHYPGAALLAGRAAARSGAGLIRVATTAPVQTMLAGHMPEATWLPLPDSEGWIGTKGAGVVAGALERVSVMLLGPGFGLAETTRAFVDQLLETKDLPPMVVDADGLKLLAGIEGGLGRLPADSILTPHPGEMAILTGLSAEDIQADREGLARRFANEWGQVLVLKGAFTVVAAPDGRTAILPLATSALATAGTGDVLAGITTGLRAQGVPAFEAASAGVWLHGEAGLQAAYYQGSEASVVAGDLLDELGELLS